MSINNFFLSYNLGWECMYFEADLTFGCIDKRDQYDIWRHCHNLPLWS